MTYVNVKQSIAVDIGNLDGVPDPELGRNFLPAELQRGRLPALRYAARTNVGLGSKSRNEDSAYAGPELLVLCDGMGGHAAGDVVQPVQRAGRRGGESAFGGWAGAPAGVPAGRPG